MHQNILIYVYMTITATTFTNNNLIITLIKLNVNLNAFSIMTGRLLSSPPLPLGLLCYCARASLEPCVTS